MVGAFVLLLPVTVDSSDTRYDARNNAQTARMVENR